MNFNINDLRLFISSAEHSSLTKAAIINNTVQSNVSARIKYLEGELSVSLFNRNTRRIELTEEGIQFLKIAKKIILSLNDFELSVNKDNSQGKKPIKLGSIQTTAALRAPYILHTFLSQHPDIEFQLKTGNTNSLIKEVLSFKLDGAFVSGDISHHDLDVQPIITEELCIVSPSIYPSIEKLNAIPNFIKLIVFNKGCSYRERFSEIITGLDIQKFRYMELDTLEGIINSVEQGIGITLLPIELVKNNYSYRSIQIMTLPKHFSNVQTVFIKRKDFPMNEGYSLFYDSIIKGYF